jgi:hypothetical protein
MKRVTEILQGSRWGVAVAAMAAIVTAGIAAADPITFLPPPGTVVQFKFDNLEPILPITPGAPVGPTIFTITTINAPGGVPIFWAAGLSDGTQLNGVLSGEFIQTITPSSGGFDFTLTGGTIIVYDVPSGSYNPTAPGNPVNPQICPGGVCPAPWLTLSLVPGIVPSIPGSTEFIHEDALTAPITGAGFANMIVTGGTASSAFPIGSIASLNFNFSTCPGVGAFTNLCLGNIGTWPVVSFDPVTAKVGGSIPEPATLLLVGLGLLGGAMVRRRRPN